MPDPVFADPRLAELYDVLEPDRSDLDAYVALVDELAARSVLDIGCGTGTFACMLAGRGLDVVGVDPAVASLDVARRKAGADRVRWLVGDATTLPPLQVDVVTMTGNVAQVFLDDDGWATTLAGAREAARPGGHVVFEVRDPSREAWREWTREESFERIDVPEVGPVAHWAEVIDVAGQLVTFRWTFEFERTGDVVVSDSTLRFRERDEVEASVRAAGLVPVDVRDAPDRPGREFVFLTQRPA